MVESAARREQPDLPAICQRPFSMIMTLSQGRDYGDLAHFRQRIRDMFADMEREGRNAAIQSEDLISARFALTAFIDEAIARSDWQAKAEWATNSLALEFFQTNNAGDEFFDKLEELRRRPDLKTGLLEVYYTCLTLGFQGKYAMYDPRQLRDLIESIGKDLERVRGRVIEISPRWQPPESTMQRMRSVMPAWIVPTICVAILFLTFVALRYLSRTHAQQTAVQVEAKLR
jgi:type VI secretion system protein ImpK